MMVFNSRVAELVSLRWVLGTVRVSGQVNPHTSGS